MPIHSAKQYGAMAAAAHGKGKSEISKKVAQEFMRETSKKRRSAFARALSKRRKKL